VVAAFHVLATYQRLGSDSQPDNRGISGPNNGNFLIF
jgi:hypothetical protein